MTRRKKRFSRRVAVALTLVLLAGQSHLSTFAQEENVTVDTEVSDSENANGDADREVSSEEISAEETISGNGDEIEEVEEPEEALATVADGIETYAVNDRFSVNGISYRVDDDSKKEVSVYGAASEAELVTVDIPATVTNEGEEWKVTKIREYAFQDRKDLVSVKIADGITEIGDSAFPRCDQLESVELPNSVTTIRPGAFADCKSLNNINIPNQLTYLGVDAFGGCSNLAIDIVIPGSLAEIGPRAFVNCSKLTNVTIPDSVRTIKYSAFEGCSSLKVLNIAVNTGNPVVPISLEDATVFKNCFPVRRIVFKRADGTAELTGEELEAAKTAYLDVDDGDKSDGKWYGWWIDDPIVYAVNIEAYKDDLLWSDSGKQFVLRMENSSSPLGSYVTDLSMVEKGEYVVYETAEDGRKISTEVKVSVVDSAVSPRVDYYTVTFYDGETAYGDDTDQRSQIVVKKGKVSIPSNPSKNGFTFDKWVMDDKTTQFNFNSSITQPTGIYATWKESAVATYKVTINVKQDGKLCADHGRTFALKRSNEPFITDLTQVENGTYDIFDITGVNPDSYYSKAVDTGMDVRVNGVDTEVDVTVQDADAVAEINYYTATFYDGNVPYGNGTPQSPQIVLSGKQVVEPEAPTKNGSRFDKWVTQNGGTVPYDFNNKIGAKTDIYASWTSDPSVLYYTITASAGAGGTIDPINRTSVREGADKTYTVIPSSGYHIASVKVDMNDDVTEQVKAADNTYTFSNVHADHTIRAEFEKDENSSGNGGGTGTGGGNGNGNGDGDSSGGGNDNGNGDSSGGGNDNGSGNGDNSGSGSSGSESSDGNVSGGSSEGVQSNAGAGSAVAGAGNNALAAAGNSGAGSKEPKTGDTSQSEIFATVAMIAGLTYLLLYFVEEGCGMTEREKEAFVAALISWAKKGGAFRKCCAMAAIFCLLVYYHTIGKRSEGDVFQKEYLGQMS